ncbi:MAG: cryptochrome/photolyase family protein [Flavisolibacter sp.]
MIEKINLFWFRRDLRLEDNAGLFQAFQAGRPVLPVFIFDRDILDRLEDRNDKRVSFIHAALRQLQHSLEGLGSTLDVRMGRPEAVWSALIRDYSIETVFCNRDYEPYALARDRRIQELLRDDGIHFQTYKDQVIFEKDEIVREDGNPYSIFTPFARKWKASLQKEMLRSFDTAKAGNFLVRESLPLPSLAELGFGETDHPGLHDYHPEVIPRYQHTRDIPSLEGTSRLGIHLRFGTVSIRKVVKEAKKHQETFLQELIWREFFMQMLWRQPSLVDHCCRPEYENISWRNCENEFERWCEGRTGYPIVDAGMRQLNETGFMHNRVRMITASFLVKHLLVDWRWGEAYFAGKLLDYELASNVGNWQWVAGCGCDAAPYFRIFNPALQTKKFDPELLYVKKWVPELAEGDYPAPIVDHEFARERCLRVFKKALAGRIS